MIHDEPPRRRGRKEQPVVNGRRRVATHWGTYLVDTDKNEITDVCGADEDPDPSLVGNNLVGTMRSKTRIRKPAVRRGWLEDGPGPSRRRGAEDFVEVEWDELYVLIADELDRVRRVHGNQAIYGGSYGWGSAGRFNHAQSQVHRFLNVIGGYTRSVNTYSHAADEVVLPHLIGDRDWFLRHVTRWSEVAEHGRYVLAFGGLPRRSVQMTPGGVGAHVNAQWQDRCAEAGVEFTVVSPARDDSAPTLGANWIAARPNTDVALMLGMCHTLLVEKRHDVDFLERCCVGFDRVADYLLGVDDGVAKSADWAAQICGVPAELITRTARRLTQQRSLVTVTWSLQRQRHGEMTYWAGLTLGAMAGSMGRPGGGFGPGYSSMHNGHVSERLSLAGALPQGRNPVEDFIPVARFCDMLLHPGGQFRYNGHTHTYPDIRLVYWVGGNPFHHQQDINKMIGALHRPDTFIVHEPFWNATAKFADIVVPVATSVELEDVAIGLGDPWMVHSEAAVPPPVGIHTDYEVFAEICGRLGCHHEFTQGRTSSQWVRRLYELSLARAASHDITLPPFEEFVERGMVELPTTKWRGPVVFSELRADPHKYPLATPSGRIELFSRTVAEFGDVEQPGHAAWFDPGEWLGATAAEAYPFHLVSPQPDGKLHSQLDHGREAARHKRKGRAVLRMNPDDAAPLRIDTDTTVLVESPRGACLATAELTDGLRRNVVHLQTGAWYDPVEPGVIGTLDKHGNPNVLTLDVGTSALAQGPSSHTCLVRISPFQGVAPQVTAHDPPRFVERPAPL